MEKTERLNRKLAYEGAVLKVYRDTVVSNGIEETFDFIHHDGAAAVIALTGDGKILMVRQYRNALDRFTLEIPAGKLKNPDEPMADCAARELAEETGYTCRSLEYLVTVNTTLAFSDEKIGIYIAKDLEPCARNLDADEVIDIEEWDITDLLDLIYKGEMTDSKTVAAILAYALKEGFRVS